MFFFIADTHFGHNAIIDLCHRPFKCVEEMNSFMIERWNEKVSPGDTVYIIGDLFYKHKEPEKVLKQLKGKKRLIVGNHDGGWLNRMDASHYFVSVDRLIEVSDGEHKLVLCHYPLLSWKHELKSYMIHGHIHNNTNSPYWSVIRNNPRLLNAGADINGFEPVSFDEMLANNKRFKAGTSDETDTDTKLYHIKEAQKMSMKYTDLHYGQIPTLYQALKSELSKSGTAAIFSLLRCFTYDVDSNDYMIQVLLTANCLERISCLVYKSRDGKYKKLSENKYKKAIFESYAETPREIYDRIQKYGVSETKAEWIHKMVWKIADLVCPMIECMSEQAFVSEYAYAIDYVIRHRCDLPKPDIAELFPRNYSNYNYWEGTFVDKVKKYIDL